MTDVQFNMVLNLTTDESAVKALYDSFGTEEAAKRSFELLLPTGTKLDNIDEDCAAYAISPAEPTMGVTEDANDTLRILQAQLNTVLAACNYYPDIVLKHPANKDLYKAYAALIEQFEFALQRTRGWPENKDKHAYWNSPKACTCPKIDNAEMQGFGRILSADCPLHGDLQGHIDATTTE